MKNPWFKFYAGEYLSDLKILQLTAQERSCWVTLLCLANQGEGGQVKFLSEAQLLIMSGVTELLTNVLKKFEELEMIQIINGVVTVKNWEKRQYSEGYSRVKKFNKRKINASETQDITIEEIRRDKKRIDKNIDKEKYGEFGKVFLKSEEYKKLEEKLGENGLKVLIGDLDRYIESLGKDKYRSHYATIQTWANRRVNDHKKLQVKQKYIA